MFCRKCGNEISEAAKFCSKCGNSVTTSVVDENISESKVQETRDTVDNNKAICSLKPTYSWGYKICTTTWKVLLYVAVLAIYFIAEFEVLGETLFVKTDFLLVVGGVLTVILLGIITKLAVEKKQYDNLEYVFYPNRVEYIDGFVNKEEKTLKYNNIREVTMSQNVLERMFSIGTIKIFTSATSGYNNSRHGEMYNRNGVVIHCVRDVRENYNKIKEIIDSNN